VIGHTQWLARYEAEASSRDLVEDLARVRIG
jgi:hypothetical protein